MRKGSERGLHSVGLPVIATVARLLCHIGRIRDGTSNTNPRPSG
jgi:hypothetical protein